MIDLSKIPICLDDITWKQYNAFRAQENFYFHIRSLDDPHKEVFTLCETVSTVVGIAPDTIYNEFPLMIEGETVEDLTHYTISLGDHLSVMRLYFHINNLVALYAPNKEVLAADEFYIEIDGEKYYFDTGLWENTMNGNIMLPTIDVVEVMHLQKRFAESVSAYEEKFEKEDNDLPKDEDGLTVNPGAYVASQDMLLGEKEAAVLLKKKGERLPYKRTLRRKFIEERAKMFGEVPFSRIADMRFFLINICQRSLMNGSMRLFGKESQESGSSVKILYEKSRQKAELSNS